MYACVDLYGLHVCACRVRVKYTGRRSTREGEIGNHLENATIIASFDRISMQGERKTAKHKRDFLLTYPNSNSE